MVRKVLIVEDQAIILEDLKSLLEKSGYNVVGSARSGEEAITLAEEVDPDVIVMDIHLQGNLDGIETAYRIQDQIKERIGFVFLSAYVQDPVRLAGIKSWSYVSKLWADRELIDAIEKQLSRVDA